MKGAQELFFFFGGVGGGGIVLKGFQGDLILLELEELTAVFSVDAHTESALICCSATAFII